MVFPATTATLEMRLRHYGDLTQELFVNLKGTPSAAKPT